MDTLLYYLLIFILVHCRQRKVDQKGHSMPSTSSNTYWQIEKESDSRSGTYVQQSVVCDGVTLVPRPQVMYYCGESAVGSSTSQHVST